MISPLQFADDTLIIYEAREDQKNVKIILLCYIVVSRLKVNVFKSDLLGVRAEDHLLSQYADILGWKVGSFPANLFWAAVMHW